MSIVFSDGAGSTAMNEAVELTFAGRLRPDSFLDFARHRAQRLELNLTIDNVTDEAVRLCVRGQPDLIDAFEMACSLGPFDCIILDVVRGARPGRHA